MNQLKTWQLLIVLLIMIFVSATLLRLNNLGMIERRNDVIAADKTADKTKIKAALTDLQSYVNSHMNADLSGGVYLESSYTRDRDAALASATMATNPNADVYKQASVDCQSRFQGGVDSFRNDYVQCVVERVSTLSEGATAEGLNLPKADLYRYNFYSPILSFDFAGLAVFFTLFISLLITLRLMFNGLARVLIKQRYSHRNS